MILVPFVLSLLGFASPAAAGLIGPGSGTATVSPTTAVVDTPGTWTFVYDPEDNFTNGTIELTIPAGWTAPQVTDPAAPGYVTVSSDHGAVLTLGVSGQTVTVSVDDLPAPKFITIVYGDDSGGANPGARAVPPSTADPTTEFLIQTDPTADVVSPIDESPLVDLKGGPATDLVFTNVAFVFQTTGEGGPYVVEARDVYGNPSEMRADQWITLSTSSGSGVFSAASGGPAVTSVLMPVGSSTVSFYYRDTVPGTPELTASASSQSWGDAAQMQAVNPGPPAQFVLSPDDTTLTAGEFLSYTISVVDAFGNATTLTQDREITLSSSPTAEPAGPESAPEESSPGEFFLPSDHDNPISTLLLSTGAQSATVDYRNTDTNGTEPHLVIMLTDDGLLPSLSGTTNVSVAAAAVHSATSQVMTTDPEAVADGVDQSPIYVIAQDEFGNPVPGVDIALFATGSAEITAPVTPTDPTGRAQGVVTNRKAEMVKVAATADGVAIADSATVVFVAGLADADSSSIDAAPLSVTANGTDESTITITAKDEFGNLIEGALVVLSISPPANGATLTQPSTLTGVDGTTTGTLASTTTGTRTVSATIDGTLIGATVDVDFTPGAAAEFVWTVDGNAVAGVEEPVTLEARDAQGNKVTDYAGKVYLTTTTTGQAGEWVVGGGASGSIGSDGGGTFYLFDPLDEGDAGLELRVFKEETITLGADDLTATGTSGPIAVDNGSPKQIEIVSGDGQSAVVDNPVASDLVVRVKDEWDNLVDGASVTFGNVTGGGSVDVVSGGGVDSVATANLLGEASCDVWQLGTTAGSNTVTAFLTTAPATDVVFSATGTPGSGTQITLTPSSQIIAVGADSPPVEATLLDTYGNPVPGKQITFFFSDTPDGILKSDTGSTNPTSGGPTTRFGQTDSEGKISVLYEAPATAGLDDTIDAAGDLATGADIPVTFSSVVGSTTNLRITGPTPNPQNAGQTFSFLVEAVDGNGNPDDGYTTTVNIDPEVGSGLIFSATDFGTPATQFAMTGGEVTIYGRGSTAGTWNFDADDDGGPLGADNGSIQITDSGVISTYVVSTVASVIAGNPFNVNVTAEDEYGNTVLGANGTIDLDAVDADTETVLPESEQLSVRSATLSSGEATVGETYTKARTMKVRVSGAPGTPGFSDAVTVTPNIAHHLSNITGDLSGIVAGNPVDLEAEVQDIYNNPVSGQLVSFAITQNPGGASIDPSSDTSDGTGLVATELTTGTTTGLNRVRASFDNGTYSDETEFDVTTQASTTISYYLFTFSPNKTTWTAGESVGVMVQAYDTNDNPVDDDATTVVFASTTGNPVFSPPSGQLTDGAFATSVSDETAEQVKLIVTTGGGEPADTSATITIVPAVAYEVTKTSGDNTLVPVGQSQPLEVTVTDPYGNPVAGEPVVFTLTLAPDGTASLSNGGITSTNASGVATIDLTVSGQAGTHNVRASIKDGNPPALETKTFTVTSIAGSIARYEVLPDVTTETAGVPIDFTVRALDGNDNLVTTASNFVDLRVLPGSVTTGFGTNPIQLSGGEATTTLAWETVGSIQIQAETQGGGATGTSVPITIEPGIPGAIVVSADPDTLTGNGSSEVTIQTDPIRDAYGNIVSTGTLITVSTDRGTIQSDDVDPAPGHQRATAPDGRVSLILRSSAIAETTVQAATVTLVAFDNPAATTTATSYFAPAPSLTVVSGPTPSVVTAGQTVGFTVDVETANSTNVRLFGGTAFKFTDGVEEYTAFLTAATWVLEGQTRTLTFSSSQINSAMDPGQYTPVVDFVGLDEYDSDYAAPGVALPVNSLRLTAIEILSISADSPVSRGQTGVIRVTVENQGPVEALIDLVSFRFSGGLYDYSETLPSPVPIAPDQQVTIPVNVTVRPTSATGTFTINATVSGTVGGAPVSDDDVAPYPLGSWKIEGSAELAYVADSLAPSTVTSGESYGFSLGVRNAGQATVTLDETLSFITFSDGTVTYAADLAAPVAIGGGAQQTIVFDNRVLPGAFLSGSYPISIHLEGDENGGAFATDLSTADVVPADLVTVVTPADITYGNELAPLNVSRQTSVSFSFTATNNGGADLVLIPDSTRFWFDGQAFDAPLVGETTIPGLGSQTLTFQSTPVSSDAGPYIPSVRVVGMENGFKRDFMLTAESITVLEATDVAIASTTTSQDTITNNQSASFNVTLNVENRGGAAIRLDNTNIEFIRAGLNQSGRFEFTPPDVFDSGSNTLAGGTNGSITFDITVNPSSLPLAGAYTIEGFLNATNLVNQDPISVDTSTGGMGALFVEEPGVLEIVDITPSRPTVTDGQTGWQIRMVVRNTGEAALDLLLPESAALAFNPTDVRWDATARSTLQGGGVRLVENEVDTLLFDVADTGVPDTYTISGQVTAEDVNSPGDEQTAGPVSGGEVTVQTPGEIRITSVTPSQDPVTKFQENDWTISVGVTNDGGAEVQLANDPARTYIEFANGTPARVTGPAGSLLLAGGASTTLTFTIPQSQDFSNGYGDQPFTAHIEGTELNRNIAVSPVEQAGSVAVQLEPDPTYVPTSLLPKNVNAGESARFRIRVTEIAGAAILGLDADRTKLSFTDGTTVIQPRLDAAVADEILAFPDTTTLYFEEVPIPSGFADGSYPVTVDIVGTENGNVFSKSFTLGDLVNVGAESAVEIQYMTTSQGAVTAGQEREWQVTMVVKNKGAATLQLKPADTKLALSVSGAGPVTGEYTIPDVIAFEGSNNDLIESEVVDSLVFNVTKTGTSTGTGALRVDGTFVGYDTAGDKDVSDNTSNIGWIDMLIQTPADLNVAASITSPPNADTLSTGQSFTLTALVTNNGQSKVDEDTGTLTLTVPGGFNIIPAASATQPFVVGTVVQWNVEAPDFTGDNQILEVAIDNRPIELNSGRLAATTDSTATVAVDIVERAGFTPTAFAIVSPPGAADSTVSADQRYIIEARTDAKATTINITATLQILSGDEGDVIDPLVRSLGNGGDEPKTVQWRIDAPQDPGNVTFRVRYDGFDVNSNEDIDAFSGELSVTTVTKARLEYTASITRPEEAIDGRVAFGTVFDIQAKVDNLGEAGVDTTGARMTIDFSQAPEYELDSGVADRSFVLGEPIVWQVRAPIQVTQPRIIRIRMSSTPDDENTGTAAVVVSSPVPIAIQTESNAVTVDDFSSDIGIEAMVVPKGTSDIDMLGIEVANLDESAEAVRIDSFRVTVLDKNGREVDDPSATISRFYVRLPGTLTTIEGTVTQNPMIIDAGGIVLEQSDADSFVFVVDISNTAQLDEIVLSFNGPFAIAVKEADSGAPIAVVDKDTGQLINGRIRSQPLVILSDQFEEYAHNYPNPFRAGAQLTRIAYIMENPGPVTIKVYDLRGSLVYERQYSQGEPGTGEGPQEVTWDGRNMQGEVVRNGMYICQLDAGGRSTRIKMAVAK